MTALRFGRFELDEERAELRRPDGETVRLRPKTLAVLQVFLANAGRVLSKQELMRAVWPNVHVGEDSLFQCIRELRVGLGAEGHQLIQLISHRGYQLVEVSPDDCRQSPGVPAKPDRDRTKAAQGFDETGITTARKLPVAWRAAATATGLCAVIALAVAATGFRQNVLSAKRPTIAVTIDASDDPQAAPLATDVTTDVIEGLSKIGNIRVSSPPAPPAAGALKVGFTPAVSPDIVVGGRLQKDGGAWNLRAHATNTKTGEVGWSTSVAVATENADEALQRSRLAGGLGHNLAAYVNSLLYPGEQPDVSDARGPRQDRGRAGDRLHCSNQPRTFCRGTKACWRMRSPAIPTMSTSRRRSPDICCAAYSRAGTARPKALRPNTRRSRFLNARCGPSRIICRCSKAIAGSTATNYYTESVVACANALAFDPWDGLVRFNRHGRSPARSFCAGAGDVQASRSLRHAAGFAVDLAAGRRIGRHADGSGPRGPARLQRSLAITPGTGRTYILLAGAYQRLGRADEAKAAMAKALALRPGSTADNMPPPEKNVSPITIAATERIGRAEIAAGLPEH